MSSTAGANVMSEMFSPSSFYAFLRNDSRSGSGFKISFMVWRWLNTIAMLFIHFYYNFFVRLLMKMFCIQSSRMPWIHGMLHAISILDDIFLLGITRPSHTMCKWQEINDGKKILARAHQQFFSLEYLGAVLNATHYERMKWSNLKCSI